MTRLWILFSELVTRHPIDIPDFLPVDITRGLLFLVNDLEPIFEFICLPFHGHDNVVAVLYYPFSEVPPKLHPWDLAVHASSLSTRSTPSRACRSSSSIWP